MPHLKLPAQSTILSKNANSSRVLIWLPNGFLVPTTSSYTLNETIRIRILYRHVLPKKLIQICLYIQIQWLWSHYKKAGDAMLYTVWHLNILSIAIFDIIDMEKIRLKSCSTWTCQHSQPSFQRMQILPESSFDFQMASQFQQPAVTF